ncbi:hypothetical protein [Paenibacillus odorifer]|nr:hypothetical protein [Paenibacillus odorifer]
MIRKKHNIVFLGVWLYVQFFGFTSYPVCPLHHSIDHDIRKGKIGL